jgi:hypothetical protein
MPKAHKFVDLPKHHAIHGTAEEKSERTLIQAENDNAEFNERAADYARSVSLIQTGVNERIARLLSRGYVGSSDSEKAANSQLMLVREERINSELYRAVHGNELSETEKEDSKNYLNSVNVAHVGVRLEKRLKNHLENAVRGVGKAVGLNNYVEARLEQRFGKKEDLFKARNGALARNLKEKLEELAGRANKTAWENLCGRLKVKTVNAACERLAKMKFEDLQELNKWLLNNLRELYVDPIFSAMLKPIDSDLALGRRLNVAMRLRDELNLNIGGQIVEYEVLEKLAGLSLSELENLEKNADFSVITNSKAFKDLKLLADTEQRASAKMGVDEVYDHQSLRKFWQNMHTSKENSKLAELVEDVLEPNSLFHLENNHEAKALLAEIRARISNTKTGTTDLILELENIRTYELPKSEAGKVIEDKTEKARLELQTLADNCRDQLKTIVENRIELFRLNLEVEKAESGLDKDVDGLIEIKTEENTRLSVQSGRILAKINQSGGASPLVSSNHTDPELARNLRENNEKIAANDLAIADLKNRGREADCLLGKRKALLELRNKSVSVQNKLEEAQHGARNIARKIEFSSVKKMVPAHWKKLDKTIAFLEGDYLEPGKTEAEMKALNSKILQAVLDANVAFDELREEVVEVKTTPFILLQRLMRRDYCRKNKLDPDKFNEEANYYALVKAGLRVEEIRNIDLTRSGNDKAAKYKRRKFPLKGVDEVVNLVARAQNYVGLEPFEIQNVAQDMLLEQLIASSPEFSVFHGVNKYTTTRDLRDILHKTGKKVSPETLLRFAEVLGEAINKFKEVPPHLYKGVRNADWDLENLVVVLKKVKVDLSARKFLAEVKLSGDEDERERVLISLLRANRDVEQKVSDSIRIDVKHPDAMWRKVLVKDELKLMLDQKELESMNKVKMAGIESKKKRMKKMVGEMNVLDQADPDKERLLKEVNNLKVEIDLVEKQISQSKDLYDRVEEARAYIRDNDLNRKEKKLYIQEMGLTQVFDKMGTNFRMQRAWHHTKRGAKWVGGKIKAGWAWSRENVINREKAGKAFSIGRVIATPVTWPLGKAWKWGTFPFRLAGRAVVRGTHMPKRLAGVFSDSMMRSYLRDRMIDLSEDIAQITTKQAKLQGKVEKAHYSWDKKRLNGRINKLEEEKQDLLENLEEYKKIATERKINVGALALNKE